MTPCTSASGTPKARLTSAAKGSGIQPRNCCAACKAGKSAARPWGASSARMDRRRMRSGSDMENLRLVYLSRFKRALHHLHALYTPAAVHHGHSPVKKTPASFFLRLRSEYEARVGYLPLLFQIEFLKNRLERKGKRSRLELRR